MNNQYQEIQRRFQQGKATKDDQLWAFKALNDYIPLRIQFDELQNFVAGLEHQKDESCQCNQCRDIRSILGIEG